MPGNGIVGIDASVCGFKAADREICNILKGKEQVIFFPIIGSPLAVIDEYSSMRVKNHYTALLLRLVLLYEKIEGGSSNIINDNAAPVVRAIRVVPIRTAVLIFAGIELHGPLYFSRFTGLPAKLGNGWPWFAVGKSDSLIAG